MNRLLFIILILAISAVSKAQSVDSLSLWDNNTAPTSNGITSPQKDKGVYWENVTSAVLTVYRPEKPNGLAVIACPGGSYLHVWERKNVSIAESPLGKKDITSYNPNSNGARDFVAFTEELLSHLNM